ncbi:MAG: sigma-70 family RNA polymerase sigma factor [Deltaproteobacteria bacterium]|nr:sigma-70 family RNA polymerase sigma factor [Deltaproteobacteria bacterium]
MLTTEREHLLLDDVLRGHGVAWESFQRHYEGLVRACIRKALCRYHAEHSHDDVEDLTADTWYLLLKDDKKKLRLFDPKRGVRLSSWIGLVTTNHVIDMLRRRRNHQSLDEISDIDPRTVSQERTPHQILEVRQSADVASRALEQLNCSDRDFLLACYRDERQPADLAHELGVSINTVYSRKFKIRAKLSRIVERLTEPRMVAHCA